MFRIKTETGFVVDRVLLPSGKFLLLTEEDSTFGITQKVSPIEFDSYSGALKVVENSLNNDIDHDERVHDNKENVTIVQS